MRSPVTTFIRIAIAAGLMVLFGPAPLVSLLAASSPSECSISCCRGRHGHHHCGRNDASGSVQIASSSDCVPNCGGAGLASDAAGAHLRGHTTADFSASKSFGERVTFSVTSLNLTNRRFLLDNSLTFGGTHYADPRQIYVQVRYRFRY